MKSSLERLFRPRSVALIGASAHAGKIGNIALKNLLSGHFEIYPVNPHEERIMGLKCYRSVLDVPGDVDLALIALPAEPSVNALRDCVVKHVKFAIVTASGFGESGLEGKTLEKQLAAAISGGGTRLLGPNSMGLVVPSSRLDTFFIPIDRSKRPRSGGLAVVSQSGAVSVSSLDKCREAGIGISSCIGLGNRIDIEENEVLGHLAEDKRTKCIALYLESLSNGREFLETAKAIVPRKPIVALMAGRTESGRAAASSHTGSIASSSTSLVSGALQQYGVMQAFEEEELVDHAKALLMIDHIDGNRVCVVASAGGYGVIASDLIESRDNGAGLRMATLSSGTVESLSKIIPGFSSARNPVDLTASVTDDMYDSVLGALMDDQGTDVILMSLELEPPNVTDKLVEVAARWTGEGRLPMVVAAFGGTRSRWLMAKLQRCGVLAYPTIWRAVRAIGVLSKRGQWLGKTK